MTKYDFPKLKHIDKEIKQKKQEIKDIEDALPAGMDIVKGSSEHFPYSQRTFKICGINYDLEEVRENCNEIIELKLQLKEIRKNKWDMLQEFYKYIDENIDDPVTREIFRLHVIQGKTFLQICFYLESKMGIVLSESGARSKYNRTYEKLI